MSKFIKKLTAFVCVGMFTVFSVPVFAAEGETGTVSMVESGGQVQYEWVSDLLKTAESGNQTESGEQTEIEGQAGREDKTEAGNKAEDGYQAEAGNKAEDGYRVETEDVAEDESVLEQASAADGQAEVKERCGLDDEGVKGVEAAGEEQSELVSELVKVAEDSEIKADGKNNDYPIVFVHGVLGYGENECMGKYYWGGDMSIREMLNSEGYEIYTPTLDAMGSNWDRACELYAYLKGGTVDYGKAHSEREGHNRYGKTFKGVLPKLGTTDEDGKLEKVHLLGHSMGGQTIRALSCLLEEGDAAEVAATGDETSPLFTGNKHWVESITTISTPHDGSQLAEALNIGEPVSHDLFAMGAALIGTSLLDSYNPMYSLGLEQWGLKQVSGESNRDYFNRIVSSNIFKKTHDTGLWDLTHEGAEEFNEKFKAEDDIYYFSVSCCATHTLKNSKLGIQVPDENINPMFWLTANYMGHHIDYFAGVIINRKWWKNDGAVSVRSAIGPHEGSKDKIVDYDGTAKKGVWNYLGEIDGVDHLEVVRQDMGVCTEYLHNKYREWAKMLSKL